MPTGYTCGVQDGTITGLKDYMLNCAKGFGAFMHMRDNSISTNVEYRKASDYYINKLDEVKMEYERFMKLTDEDIQVEIDKNYEKTIRNKQEGLKKFKEGKQRYFNMLQKVREWEAPTEEHNNLKKFAIEQLENSLDFDYSDGSLKYYEESPSKETVQEYKAWKLKDCLKDMEYYSKAYREEMERVEEANQWIKDLVGSFE